MSVAHRRSEPVNGSFYCSCFWKTGLGLMRTAAQKNAFEQCFKSCTAPAGHQDMKNNWLPKTTAHCHPFSNHLHINCFLCRVNVHKQDSKSSCFMLRHRRIQGSRQKLLRRKKLIWQKEKKMKRGWQREMWLTCALSVTVSACCGLRSDKTSVGSLSQGSWTPGPPAFKKIYKYMSAEQ